MESVQVQGQTEGKLTAEEKKIGQSIENLPLLSMSQKIGLLLVWRRLKDAYEIILPLNSKESDIQKIKKDVKEIGLFMNDEIEKNGYRYFFIANNKKDSELIAKLWFDDHYKPEVCSEMGRISGFPKTAIESMLKIRQRIKGVTDTDSRPVLLSFEEMENLIPSDIEVFTNFRVSRENWQEKIKTAERWAEEIKLVCPNLFNTFVEDHKRVRNFHLKYIDTQ